MLKGRSTKSEEKSFVDFYDLEIVIFSKR